MRYPGNPGSESCAWQTILRAATSPSLESHLVDVRLAGSVKSLWASDMLPFQLRHFVLAAWLVLAAFVSSPADAARVEVVEIDSGEFVEGYSVPPVTEIEIEPGQRVVLTDVEYGDPVNPNVIIAISGNDVQVTLTMVTLDDGTPATVLIKNLFRLMAEGKDVRLAFADSGQIFGAGPDGPQIPAFASVEDLLASLPSGIPASGGGDIGAGQVFALVPILTWWLYHLDVISEAQAAEPAAAASGERSPVLTQLLAQLAIAREGKLQQLATQYLHMIDGVIEEVRRFAEAGRASEVDILQAEASLLQARLELKEAEFRLILAVDAHQDAFDERLETADFPQWVPPPPNDLEVIRRTFPPDRFAVARKYVRQARFSKEILALLDQLLSTADQLVTALEQRFALDQTNLEALLNTKHLVFQTKVRLAQRNYDLKSAEARLLAAQGQLSEDHIRRPGWE